MYRTSQIKNQKMIFALAIMSGNISSTEGNNRYEEYNRRKQLLQEECLTSEEYEKEVRQLSKELRI